MSDLDRALDDRLRSIYGGHVPEADLLATVEGDEMPSFLGFYTSSDGTVSTRYCPWCSATEGAGDYHDAMCPWRRLRAARGVAS